MSLVVLVTGGRTYGVPSRGLTIEERAENIRRAKHERSRAFAALSALHAGPRGPVRLVRHGAADGMDALAEIWAQHEIVPTDPMPADWRYGGNAAGHMRNAAMVAKTAAEPGDKVCLAAPGGKGTTDCVRRARAAGLEIVEVEKGCAG